jgi:CRP-like cAMP-binding protein
MDVKHLQGLALFERLSKDQLAEVARQADEIDVEAGKRLVSEGRFGYEFFVIENGTAQVVHGDEHIADLGPGDFFGEMALLGDTVRNADVISSSPMTAMVMTDSAFRSLARRMPDVAQEIRDACRRRTEELAGRNPSATA